MWGNRGKVESLRTPEEKEIFRLEAEVMQLTENLSMEKEKSSTALLQEKNKHAQLVAQGRSIERERIIRVCSLQEFQGRERMALQMLSDSPTATPKTIGALLRNVPKIKSSGGQLDAYMKKLGNPDVGADFDNEELESTNILQSIARGEV